MEFLLRFLSLIGAGVLALFVLFVVVVVVLWFKARRFLKTVDTLVRTVSSPAAQLRLRPMAVNDWDDAAAVRGVGDSLAELGFVRTGEFEVEGIDGLRIQTWAHAQEAVTAMIQEGAGLHPPGLSLCLELQDGSRMVVANGPREVLWKTVGQEVEFFPERDTATLFHTLRDDFVDRLKRPLDPSGFRSLLERVQVESAASAWRTNPKARAVAALTAEGVAFGGTEFAEEADESEAIDDLEQSLLEQFLASSGLSALEWERMRERVIIVHDRTAPESLDEILADLGCEKPFEFVQGATVRHSFEEYNARLPLECRFKLMSTERKPVGADVYCAPE